MDKQQCTILVLLDFSVAFDTVDHQILLDRLKDHFGITGIPLNWIKSYLSDRSQCVMVSSSRSNSNNLDCNVPQGSVLGPDFYGDFTAPVDNVTGAQITNHFYADDSQLYKHFNPNNHAAVEQAVTDIEKAVSDVKSWMNSNLLKLNDDKTEVLIIGSKQQLKKVSIPSLTIGDASIKPTKCVRNIGAIFDANMSFVKHIDNICNISWYHLRNIRHIRKYLTPKATEVLVHAFISSKLDNLNSLLYGLPMSQLKRLQRVQNSAAKLITVNSKYDHVTPILKRLHWLPILQRIEFKILLLTYKAIHGLAPEYIANLLHIKEGHPRTRSSESHNFVVPSTKCKTFGDRCFSVAAPKLWNSLPCDIKLSVSLDIFKQKLKTHLCKMAYKS